MQNQAVATTDWGHTSEESHQLIEAQKDEYCPNQRAAQVACMNTSITLKCSQSLVHGRARHAQFLMPISRRHMGERCTSREGDPLDSPSHLREPSQLRINLH